MRRGDRAIPPDSYDDIPFHSDVMAPWSVAWKLAYDERGPWEIERTLHDRFRLPWRRVRDMARFVTETVARRIQMSTSVDSLPQADVDRAAKAIRDEIERMAEEFDADRGRLCNEWTDFQVAQAINGTNYTLVPPDFYERLARAVLLTIAPCTDCVTQTLYSCVMPSADNRPSVESIGR
ncbi:MAG: hypothetical protein WC565_09550 [Parcubacteria group bacterium]